MVREILDTISFALTNTGTVVIDSGAHKERATISED